MDKAVLRDAIDTWGPELQKIVAIEECSEVIKEICKYERGQYSKLHMAEEIADLEIMLAQLEIMDGKNKTNSRLPNPSTTQIINSISYLQMCIADSITGTRVGRTEVSTQLEEVEYVLKYIKKELDIGKLVEVYKERKLKRLAERIDQVYK